MGYGDGDKVVPSEEPCLETHMWARYLIYQVCWSTAKVLSLKARHVMQEFLIAAHKMGINILQLVHVPRQQDKTQRSRGAQENIIV